MALPAFVFRGQEVWEQGYCCSTPYVHSLIPRLSWNEASTNTTKFFIIILGRTDNLNMSISHDYCFSGNIRNHYRLASVGEMS